ncbi:MAG: molybdopterin-dependent oxidoreductase [Haloarculaceae archaeon]
MTGSLPSPRTRDGAGLAILAGLVGVAGSYALAGPSNGFVVVPVHSFIVDHTPALVLRFAIVVLGELGDYAGVVLALLSATALLAAVAAVALLVGDRHGTLAALATAYGLSWVVATLLTRSPWASLGATLAMVATLGIAARYRRRRRESASPVSPARRLVLRTASAVLAIGAGYALGNRAPLGEPPELSTLGVEERATVERRLQTAAEKSLDVPGIPGLVSPLDAFYEVDIDAVNPGVDTDSWSLSVTGAVDRELTLSYADLTDRDPVHEFKTLRCVGEDLNGHKLDTALWTGVPAGRLLDEAGVHPDATHVVLRAVDGYDEEFPLDAMQEGLVAYGMNGHVLPRKHGRPVRALVPGRWGEVNVKWLTDIEVIAGEHTGYWERRNWEGTGPVTAVAKLHAVDHLGDGRVRVAGHAYAGTRGVDRVEVRVDGGAWHEATLSDPLDATDVWRMWSFTYEPPDGRHTVVVRTVDGTGTVQIRTNTAAFPSGATGWVSKRVRP